MVLINRVTTGVGDGGQTALGDGQRVFKDEARVEALGAVDEANAAIGLTRVYAAGAEGFALGRMQDDLFALGADLAVPGVAGDRLRISAEQVRRLEAEIAEMNTELRPLESF